MVIPEQGFKRQKDNYGTSALCNINVNCQPVGQIKESIVRIVLDDAGTCYPCSGSLLNTTKEDGELYVLTAFHCVCPIISQRFANY